MSDSKICSKCEVEKEVNLYAKHAIKWDENMSDENIEWVIHDICSRCEDDERRKKHIIKQQGYYKKNKERIIEYARNYEKEHKEEMREWRGKWGKEKITCICGSTISRGYKSTHLKNNKHLKYIEETN